MLHRPARAQTKTLLVSNLCRKCSLKGGMVWLSIVFFIYMKGMKVPLIDI